VISPTGDDRDSADAVFKRVNNTNTVGLPTTFQTPQLIVPPACITVRFLCFFTCMSIILVFRYFAGSKSKWNCLTTYEGLGPQSVSHLQTKKRRRKDVDTLFVVCFAFVSEKYNWPVVSLCTRSASE